MEGRSIESGPVSPEYTKNEIMEFIEKYKEEREKTKEAAGKIIEDEADKVREKIKQEGITMETMKSMMEALEMTGYEAFSSAELFRIVEVLDFVILEVDPVYKPFYQNLKQRLTGIIEEKRIFEKL